MKRRTEEEMLSLILGFAGKDSRVRAVWMNGSRANPDAPRDCWQDFDIVYAVEDLPSFLQSESWLDVFGERVIMQSSREQFDRYDETGRLMAEDWYIAMMQFADGSRIDLSLIPAGNAAAAVLSDRMCRVLLDKDGRLPPLPPATDADYRVKPPSALEFRCCENEFRWVILYAAKGIARKELPYAHGMLDGPVRDALNAMLGWRAGVRTGFSVNIGKCGKYLERYLLPEEWTLYCQTYCGSRYEEIAAALLAAYRLFSRVSHETAEALGFSLEEEEEARVLSYLKEMLS